MGACETNSVDGCGPSRPAILRRPSPASRSLVQSGAPPCPRLGPANWATTRRQQGLTKPDLMGAD
jgi:hypothetical protein